MQYFSINPIKGRAFSVALAFIFVLVFVLITQRLYLPLWQLGFYNLGVFVHLFVLLCLPVIYFRLAHLQRMSVEWPFSLSINGDLLLNAQQYQIDDRSLYMGRWIFLIYRHSITNDIKRSFFAPDNLSVIDRCRLKRVLKKR